MDVDGDGVLSMYELECFYMEQVEKMDILGIDVVPFCDCLCQVLPFLYIHYLCNDRGTECCATVYNQSINQ